MTAHAILSASSSKRWLTCTPSARLEATLPERRSAPGAFNFSEEGTTAHTLADIKLRRAYNQMTGKEYAAEYAKVKASQYYDDEFEAHVDGYVVYVRSQIGEGDRPLFEQRVDYSDWAPDGFGTADVVILSERKVRVIDLKFGKGVPVDARDNPQLRLYALGAYAKYREEFPNITEVEYTICQPRLDSITTDHTTVERLLDWADYFVKQKAKKAWTGVGEFVAGDHCQFCRAKSQCRARSDFNNDIAKLEFRAPALLDSGEMELILGKSSKVKAWLTDVEVWALDRAVNDGTLPPGYHLGRGTTHRKITDEVAAAERLIAAGIEEAKIWENRALKSIAKLEKVGKKEHIQQVLGELITRPEGALKLIRVDEDAKKDFA